VIFLAGPAAWTQAVNPSNNRISEAGRERALTNAMIPNRTRGSLTGTGASQAREMTPASDYHFRVGEIRFLLIPEFEVEYNSNVNFSTINPVADLILRPRLTLNLDWLVTRKNRLALNVGLEYEKYLRNVDRDYNGLRLRPDTVLSYSVYTGDFVITAYTRPSIEQDPGGDPTLVNTAPYQRFMNSAGLSVVWDLNKVILSAVGERQDVRSLNGNFSGLNSATYLAQLSSMVLFTPTFSAGPFALVSQTDYEEATLNDYTQFQFGLSANHVLSPYTTLNASGGLQVMEFQDTGNQQPGLTTDSDGLVDNVTGTAGGGNFVGPFFSVGINNRLNRHFTQQFGVWLQPQASSVSNYTQVFAVSYDLEWRMNRLTRAWLGLRYDNGRVSGDSPSYQRTEIKAGLEGPLTPSIKWRMQIGYRFEAQTAGAGNIAQTRCVVGLSYDF